VNKGHDAQHTLPDVGLAFHRIDGETPGLGRGVHVPAGLGEIVAEMHFQGIGQAAQPRGAGI